MKGHGVAAGRHGGRAGRIRDECAIPCPAVGLVRDKVWIGLNLGKQTFGAELLRRA